VNRVNADETMDIDCHMTAQKPLHGTDGDPRHPDRDSGRWRVVNAGGTASATEKTCSSCRQYRHINRETISFCDGHVESMRSNSVMGPKLASGRWSFERFYRDPARVPTQ